MTTLPPKPRSRPKNVSLLRHALMFRRDVLSAQPERLYGAWMAEFRTPLFRTYLLNQPDLVKTVLDNSLTRFPKSTRIRDGLTSLLGNSLFLSSGEDWLHQRRIVDPAFEGGRLREVFPMMWDCAVAAMERLEAQAGDSPVEVEAMTSHVAADVIFRTLFSLPITDKVAAGVFEEFRDYQRSMPLANTATFFPRAKWLPSFLTRRSRRAAERIRALIRQIAARRSAEIAAGTAPDDLATKLMTTPDPETGACFDTEEMVDQVSIFFLAGHETSASALAWSLYMLALYPEWQDRIAAEAEAEIEMDAPRFSVVSRLKLSRDVFRETLRLYPPVPNMVRETTCPETFRERDIKTGSQIIVSSWYMHRHTRIWDRPDEFCPHRFSTPEGKASMRDAYIPFSAGPRVCPGAAFAMLEGPLILSMLVRAYRFELVQDRPAVPIAHLTLRSRDGIWLKLSKRTPKAQAVPGRDDAEAGA
ncbi:cytochrome P450 [Aliiruegeria haliotis]|uniref:Cytochrome P450 n=1 Tax=Aliiruegeria haliotis TaxID=1280846 RepID=A0A2T0RYN6_9RHOB|nr:cytochrome P450 [Aliiruegeria haliotis]PRY26291.1 cytochrome P450 [Aliiruegeria haliotis]